MFATLVANPTSKLLEDRYRVTYDEITIFFWRAFDFGGQFCILAVNRILRDATAPTTRTEERRKSTAQSGLR
jgi:hypothetical protein